MAIDYELFPENNFNERTLHNQIINGTGWVVRAEGKLAAYMLCSGLGTPLLDILRLGVREPYRQTGIASKLLETVKEFSGGVMLTVKKNNAPAIRLYRKHGFEITGTMPQHDCWVMRIRKTSS